MLRLLLKEDILANSQRHTLYILVYFDKKNKGDINSSGKCIRVILMLFSIIVEQKRANTIVEDFSYTLTNPPVLYEYVEFSLNVCC